MQLTYSNSEKTRLDKFLHEEFPEYSRTQIQRFIKGNNVLVNNKRAEIHHWLKKNDTIEAPEISIKKDSSKAAPRHTAAAPAIVFQNSDFAVILKPAGLLMHQTEAEEEDTLVAWALKTFPGIERVGEDPLRPGIVHRLDKDVSGIVLIALNQETFRYFKKLFQDHSIIKKYYALVHGVIDKEEGVIEMPIERSRKTGHMIAQSATGTGKSATTKFQVLQKFHNYTLLDVQIITGRTHQIRTHFYSTGHSIVGDELYKTRDLRKQPQKNQLTDRPFLFSHYLAFTDQHGQAHEFSVELPDDFKKILAQLP